MRISDLMTRQVVTISPAATLQAAALQMREAGVGILPVREGGQLQGVITDRDIIVRAVAQGLDARTTPVSEAMTTQIVTCFEDEPLNEAVQRMESRAVRRLVVTDRADRPVGMLSLDDLAAVEAGRVAEVLSRVANPNPPDGFSG